MHPAADEFEDDIERAVEDKREAILAADATGMVRSEETILVAETRASDVEPDS
jgi:hypothetical protein